MSVFRRTERTAAKPHTCTFCAGPIAAGTRYIDGFWLCQGEPTVWRAHPGCQALADAYPDAGDGVPPFADWDPQDIERLSDEQRAALARLTAGAGAPGAKP